jgi:hypothetical protein
MAAFSISSPDDGRGERVKVGTSVAGIGVFWGSAVGSGGSQATRKKRAKAMVPDANNHGIALLRLIVESPFLENVCDGIAVVTLKTCQKRNQFHLLSCQRGQGRYQHPLSQQPFFDLDR